MTFLQKVGVGLVLIGALVGVGRHYVRKYQEMQQARTIAELQLAGQQQLNDSTAARLAVETAAKDSLSGLLAAAKQLHGTLISGVVLRIPEQRGLFSHSTLATKITPDSTRYAQFYDSTFAGIIEGTITAPPCCAPLGITYSIRRPEFKPEVGFVRVANRVVATVVWAGQIVQITAPFSVAPQTPVKRLGASLEADYRPIDARLALRGTIFLRAFWGLTILGGTEYITNNTANLVIGLRKEW
jgi:hypothetical protein